MPEHTVGNVCAVNKILFFEGMPSVQTARSVMALVCISGYLAQTDGFPIFPPSCLLLLLHVCGVATARVDDDDGQGALEADVEVLDGNNWAIIFDRVSGRPAARKAGALISQKTFCSQRYCMYTSNL